MISGPSAAYMAIQELAGVFRVGGARPASADGSRNFIPIYLPFLALVIDREETKDAGVTHQMLPLLSLDTIKSDQDGV